MKPSSLVAAMQRRHIAALQATQARRILVQPRTTDPAVQKTTPWIDWAQAPEGVELWTRSVLLTEVLFDVDTRLWRLAATRTADLLDGLNALGAPSYDHLSGGKGTHTSVFIDPASIHLPRALLGRAERAGVDVWSHARLAAADAILDAAGIPPGDDARWAPPIGNGVFDRLKVKWNALRNGSMVRVIGAPGGAGFRKTLVADDFDWRRAASLPGPPSKPLRFHLEPVPWPVPRGVSDAIATAVEADVAGRETARETAPSRPGRGALRAVLDLKAIPCIVRILEGPPKGTRHYAFLNLAVMAKALGVPRQAARRLLIEALAKCGLDARDPAMQTLDEVYDGHYSLTAPRCPSPHVSSWCNPNRCCLAGRFEFGVPSKTNANG